VDLIPSRTLRHLLDNAEVAQSLTVTAEEGEEGAETVKVEKKDEMKVIAFI
jgi:hypothetical protein